jgi:PIN domain nuclease of toxin-antitoxin system
MPVSAEQARAYFEQAGYGLLDITPAQVVAVDALPKLRADPFDRILIAQALMVPLRLLTRDARIARYGGVVIAV